MCPAVHVFSTSTLFYTKNGRHLGAAASLSSAALYPTISLHSPGEQVRTAHDVMSCHVHVRCGCDDVAGLMSGEACHAELVSMVCLYCTSTFTHLHLHVCISMCMYIYLHISMCRCVSTSALERRHSCTIWHLSVRMSVSVWMR